ncbi:hypothetical protein GCM10009722_19790 [Williamsia deligens]
MGGLTIDAPVPGLSDDRVPAEDGAAPPRPTRRDGIMSAAVVVLAERGPRGFTHRAVDAQAGLGQGAVNYHAPSRSKLLSLALEEVFRRDTETVIRHFALDDWSPDTVVAAMTAFIDDMTTGENRMRVIARHHLRGESVTSPEVKTAFDEQQAVFVRTVQDGFASAGHPIGLARAELFRIAVDGLLSRQVMYGAEPLTADVIEEIARRLVES